MMHQLIRFVLLSLIPTIISAFQQINSQTTIHTSRSFPKPHRQPTPLSALSPRQLQFWEDVKSGLRPIETYYKRQNLDIDRIWTFCERAKSGVPAVGVVEGHEPGEEHVDGLTAMPFWDTNTDPTNFPWSDKLQSNAHVIIDEFRQQLLTPTINSNNNSEKNLFASDSYQNAIMGSGWSAFRLQRLGVWNVDNCAKFPNTYNLLRELDIPLAVRGVCFARQVGGSGVAEHSDGRNFILTGHLGLSVPDGCWIKVGNEKRTWTEGKLTTLDTSFIHSTGNPTTEDRHVLIIDFWHPELTEAERAALEFIYDLRNKFENGEIPFRQPKSQQEGQGLGGLWNALTGGGD